MVKKLTLNIPDDSYRKLASLSDFYKQDVKKAIVNILELVGWQGQRIMNLSKQYRVPLKLNAVIYHILEAGFASIYGLFNEVLEKLEVKGLYTLEDFGIDPDENYIWLA